MRGLDDLTGASFGPFPVEVTAARVEQFASAIGFASSDGFAPPMLANLALFSAAPAFLGAEGVVPYTRSLIHSEQSYEWRRPLEVGETIEVVGTVAGVRARGPLNLVTFNTTAGSARGPWLTGSSVFLMSTEAAGDAVDESEPAENDRPPFDAAADRLGIPQVGEALAPFRCGASRADLVRYASATEDRNPIHFDHAAARAAGLGGVIVHGLLMGAWMAGAAERYGTLAALRLRFRAPLRPSVPAIITGTVVEGSSVGAELDLVLSAGGDRLVTGRASVTL